MIKSKISRHLLVHKLEPRVNKVCLLPKRSEERRIELEILANEGNFKHNIDVLTKKHGFLVVGRREETNRNIFKPGDYLPCEFCRKFIQKRTLWLHHRTCSVRKFQEREKSEEDSTHLGSDSNNAVRRGRHLLHSALMQDSDPFVTKMLDRMHDDEIKDVVTNDKFIRKYAALRIESLGCQRDQKINDIHRVSQCCRTLARLILQCRKENLTAVINLDTLISPEHFDLVVSSTKLFSVNKENPAVSLGRYLGNILGHIIQVKIGDALRSGGDIDGGRCEKAAGFQKLFEGEWNYRVNSVCLKRMNTLNRQKVQTIPLTDDLKTLNSFLVSNMNQASSALKENPISTDWIKLAKFTMCRLILFNKRRRAEVKDLKVTDYASRPNWHEDQRGEFNMALSHADKVLASRMDMVISAGKSRKNVDAYVLLPPDSKDAIDLLNSLRKKVGVKVTNPYIFARIGADTPLTGNTELREIVDSCPGIQYPDRISSTSLRKYIATVSQILDMTDPELEMLATHLGHDVKTHKENYRLSHSTRELTKVSQLLLAVENGQVNSWKGKHLSEVSIDELPAVEDVLKDHEDETEEEGTESNSLQSDEEDLDGSSSLVQRGLDHGSTGKNSSRVKKRPWTEEENEVLMKKFKFYFAGIKKTVHNTDMEDVQKICPSLRLRTKAQIRSKLNNIKLGKCTQKI